MKTASTVKFTFWQDGAWYLGYLEAWPDYITQASTLDELKVNLSELYSDLTGGHIPAIRQSAELNLE